MLGILILPEKEAAWVAEGIPGEVPAWLLPTVKGSFPPLR